jgi:hypothetical protein
MGRSVGRTSGSWCAVAVSLTVALAACKPPPPPPPPHRTVERPPAAVAAEAEREREALEAAVEAYVYGYPLVSSELARRIATNVEKPQGGQAPMGQLARPHTGEGAAAARPRASFDTLAAGAWIDVGIEPWVLSVPDAKGRFHAITIRSAWQDLLEASPIRGGRARAGRIVVTGPGWSGKLPAGARQVKSPTALVRIDARVLAVGGPNDPREAQAWVERLTLLPLGANPRKWAPPLGRPDASLDTARPVLEQVNALDAVVYFKLLASLLKQNPPASADAAILPTLARIGLVPGKDYDPTGLDASVIKALAGVPKVAQAKILAAAAPPPLVNGWSVGGGRARADGYLGRAAAVAAGFDQALEGVALTAEADGAGKPLDGSVRRTLRFTRGKGPPAEVLWTLSAYDASGAPVTARQGRAQLHSKEKFQYGRDGSLDLLLQADAPRGRESNWLQVPAGPYALVLRLHAPREKPPSALDGSWKPPAVVKTR